MIKVNDKRRFDSSGNPRESDAPKCGGCDGHGKLAVDPTLENLAILEARNAILADNGLPPEEMPTEEECPECGGTGVSR